MMLIITGTSSSGKSSVCTQLHQKLGAGWLNFSTDGYLGMLGEPFWNLTPDNKEVTTPNDVAYAKQHPDGSYEIIPGKYCSRLYNTIADALVLLGQGGFHVIVDAFITTEAERAAYQEKLAPYHPVFIYLYAEANIIAAREEARGDRLKGSALHWLKQFNCQDACHLSIDTETMEIAEVAALILEHCVR